MSQSNSGYEWKSIIDLPENWEELQNPELYSLASVWKEQHAQLTESRSVKEFNERLLREWSIETGILERLYTIDRGTTQLLIEQGFDASLITHGATNVPVGELIAVIKDHRDAIEGLFDFVGSRRTLSLNYIKQLHQVITRNQKYVEGKDQFGNIVQMEVQRGEWKKWANNPTRPDGLIHEYCPPIYLIATQTFLPRLMRHGFTIGLPKFILFRMGMAGSQGLWRQLYSCRQDGFLWLLIVTNAVNTSMHWRLLITGAC
jgi:hypothetical protein